ncbi:hypothetical protein [Flavobacterium sp. 7A]|uniref:hypothetical protein n=1 Tax=Flavobacterium sp. 7A TaxID=2940571 RepID=UPI002225B9FA|nr:hypothetical protein [Flavobacterium sp. 7A]MCW2118306.1 hypothetical protein [Flavobacterium sp. 7A]
MKNDIDYLYQRATVIIHFLVSKSKDDSIIRQVETVVNVAYRNKKVKDLKSLSRDLNSWANGLSRNDGKELELILKDRFQDTLSGDAITINAIQELLNNGKIVNEESYRIIYEYLLEISKEDFFYERKTVLENLIKECDSTQI